jgi:catechol 2,3-dioxygenase-like lactoylglutathione lyase family enzyme
MKTSAIDHVVLTVPDVERTGAGRGIYIKDPDGNRVELRTCPA